MRLFRTLITTMLCCAAGSASATDFKTLVQQQVDAGPSPAPKTIPYTYMVSIDLDGRSGKDGDKDFQGAYRFDPTAAPGERTQLLGMDWEDFPKDMRKDMERADNSETPAQFAEDFWCVTDAADLAVMASDSVTVLRETESEAVVSLSPDAIGHFLGGDSGDGERSMPKKIKKRMAAELTFSKPDLILKTSHIWLTEPTSVKIVAKMKAMDFKIQCDIAPNGLPYFSGSETSVDGKALGKSFQAQVNMTISDLRPN